MNKYYKERTVNGYSIGNIDSMIKANEKLNLTISDLKNKIKFLEKDISNLKRELKKKEILIKDLRSK